MIKECLLWRNKFFYAASTNFSSHGLDVFFDGRLLGFPSLSFVCLFVQWWKERGKILTLPSFMGLALKRLLPFEDALYVCLGCDAF
jgi:hypothetical protein